MVFFTCFHCGESVKKPSVAKHYQTKCRKNEPFLTCVDCLKDFKGTEFEAHTKCVTEDERYSAKGFVPKPSQNKGERKQQAWQECIQTVLKKPTLKPDERDLIGAISKFDNVPRKKAKFINFLSNAFRQYSNKNNLIDRVWTQMESVFKETAGSNEEQNQKEKSQEEDIQSVSKTETPKVEKNGLKKEKKRKRQTEEEKIAEAPDSGNTDEKVKKKKQKSIEENSPEATTDALVADETESKQKKKHKKRKADENGQAEQNDSVLDETEPGKKKKKKKHDKHPENQINETVPDHNPEAESKTKKKRKKSKSEEEKQLDVETEPPSVVVERGAGKKKKIKKSENKENCGEKAEGEAEKATSKKKKTKGETGAEEDKQETFDWKETILNVLNQDSKNKRIQLQKLQKKVLKLHCQILNCENSEKKEKKFMKKLREMTQIEIDNDFVLLKS